MIAGLVGLAWAGPAPCTPPPTSLPDPVSVAWVAPLKRRVGSRRRLTVVQTSALMGWASRTQASPERVVSTVGSGRRSGPYKVVLFDVPRATLCRSDPDPARPTQLDAFEARWRDLVRDGFCVMPLETFLAR